MWRFQSFVLSESPDWLGLPSRFHSHAVCKVAGLLIIAGALRCFSMQRKVSWRDMPVVF